MPPRRRAATPALNAPKNGLAKMTDRSCGVSMPIAPVRRWVEHPGDRVRPVAELVGDAEDPGCGVGVRAGRGC